MKKMYEEPKLSPFEMIEDVLWSSGDDIENDFDDDIDWGNTGGEDFDQEVEFEF